MGACLVDAGSVPVRVVMEANEIAVPTNNPSPPILHGRRGLGEVGGSAPTIPTAERGLSRATVPLIALAHGRSGDKGDDANIGVLARRPEYLPAIRDALTEAAVAAYFAHLLTGGVDRYDLPGLHGLNFVLHGALDGGGTASLRHDAQGKAFAQMLMDFPVPVPAAWRAPDGPLAGWGA
jgi:hypothetical protein